MKENKRKVSIGLLDMSRMSNTHKFKRKKNRLASKIDMVKSGIIQRRGNRKRTLLIKKAKNTLKSHNYIRTPPPVPSRNNKFRTNQVIEEDSGIEIKENVAGTKMIDTLYQFPN